MRLAAVIQLVTAMRCRMTPAAACTTPRTRSTPTARSTVASSPSAAACTPAPSAAGTAAIATIQTVPQNVPTARVFHCLRATQRR